MNVVGRLTYQSSELSDECFVQLDLLPNDTANAVSGSK